MSWSGDGFYYNSFPKPNVGGELSDSNQNSKVFYHKLGTSQSEDTIIFSDPNNPKISSYPSTTDDGRFLMIYRTKGTYGQSLMVSDLNKPDNEFITIVSDYSSEISIIDHIDGKLIAITDRNAPKKKVVLIDPFNPKESSWKTIITEKDNVLSSINRIGGKLITHYMVDIISKWIIFDIDGNKLKKYLFQVPAFLMVLVEIITRQYPGIHFNH